MPPGPLTPDAKPMRISRRSSSMRGHRSRLLEIMDRYGYGLITPYDRMERAAKGFAEAVMKGRSAFLIDAPVEGLAMHAGGYTPFSGDYLIAARTTGDIKGFSGMPLLGIDTGLYRGFTKIKGKTYCEVSGFSVVDRFSAGLFSGDSASPYAVFEIEKMSEGGIYLLRK